MNRARPNWPENWLLPKLKDDGAKVDIIGDTDIPYLDQRLFLVTLPGYTAMSAQ